MPFIRAIESSTEEGGRPAFDPQLLISLWVYAYSQGIGSAREVARRCEYDPAFQWLTGLQEVNYHTLADFRVEKQQELDELFTQVLAALSKEGLITLEQVMQDGTKIKALASTQELSPGGTIREHLERARRRVAEMGDPRNDESNPKAKQAQARARREQQERLESALEELEKWQAAQERRKGQEGNTGEHQRSASARDAASRWRISAQLQRADFHRCSAWTDCGSGGDAGSQRHAHSCCQRWTAWKQRLEKKPRQMVADGGYTTRENIEKMAGTRDRFSGKHAVGKCAERREPPEPASAECISSINQRRTAMFARRARSCIPQGRHKKGAGLIYLPLPSPKLEDCQSCPRKPECCPDNKKRGRSVSAMEESPVVMAFRQKMASEEAREQYRRRGQSRGILPRLDQKQAGSAAVSRAGLVKVQMEMLWACLTYNLQHWIRLNKLRTAPAVT